MSKIITVFGATGNQGGSVIKSILADPVLSKEFKIRGITRDVSKPAAQELAKQGVELMTVRANPKEPKNNIPKFQKNLPNRGQAEPKLIITFN